MVAHLSRSSEHDNESGLKLVLSGLSTDPLNLFKLSQQTGVVLLIRIEPMNELLVNRSSSTLKPFETYFFNFFLFQFIFIKFRRILSFL